MKTNVKELPVTKSYKIVGENITNIIMALLIGSAGCSFASLASEEYISINNNKKYGIFEGKEGGSGCLGQCIITSSSNPPLECRENNEYCVLFKTFPIISGILSIVATSLLTFTYEISIMKFNKEIATWIIMWTSFLFGLIGLLLQIFTPMSNGESLWTNTKNCPPLVGDPQSGPSRLGTAPIGERIGRIAPPLADANGTVGTDTYCVKWGEGFILMCSSVGLVTLAVVFHGIHNTKLWSNHHAK